MANYPYKEIGIMLDIENLQNVNDNFQSIAADLQTQKVDYDTKLTTQQTEYNGKFGEVNARIDNIASEIEGEVYEEIVNGARLIWQEPVATFADLATTYPAPEEGWTSMARDTGIVYRFNGTSWLEIQEIDATAINEVDSRLTSQLAETAKVINVKKFGAKGDGVTDDSDAIQAAVDSVTANATIAFNGVHLISKEIVIENKENITLTGASSTLLKSTNWLGSESTIFKVLSCNDITFKGLLFEGQDVAFPSTPHEWAIWFHTNVFNGVVEKCTFKNFPRANLFAAVGFTGQTTSARNKVVHCDFTNLGGGSVFIQARRTIVAHNTIDGNRDVPIALNSPNAVECVVSNNIIEDTGKFYAIAVEDGPSNYDISHNQVINSNGIVQHLTQAYPTAVRGGSIKHNRMVGSPDLTYTGVESVQGIFLNEYYTDVEIEGNTFVGLLNKGTEPSCLYMINAVRPVVKHNTFDGTIGDVVNGVTIAGATKNPVIQQNKLMNLSRGIFNASADTENLYVSDNEFYNFDAGTEGVRSTVGTVKDNRFYNFAGAEYAGFPFGIVFDVNNRNKPHVLSTIEQTVFYRGVAPSSGTFKNGDRVLNTVPVAAGGISEWYHVAGTWLPRQIGILVGGETLPTPSYIGELIRQSGVVYIAVGTASNTDWRQITN